jgi:hypothetical protein
MALSLVALNSPAPAMTMPSPYGASFDPVPQIQCFGPRGESLGSGVRIRDDLIITAAHVNSDKACHAYGVELHNMRFEPGQDIAFLGGTFRNGFRQIVSCEGIKEGQRYLALGYADGGSPDVEVLIGTGDKKGTLTLMRGHVYHGMSGGAVLNADGALVAIINAMNAEGRPIAYVTPVSQTYLCANT